MVGSFLEPPADDPYIKENLMAPVSSLCLKKSCVKIKLEDFVILA